VRAFVNGCLRTNSLLGAAAIVKRYLSGPDYGEAYAQHSLRTANRASSTLARSRSRSPATGASAIARGLPCAHDEHDRLLERALVE